MKTKASKPKEKEIKFFSLCLQKEKSFLPLHPVSEGSERVLKEEKAKRKKKNKIFDFACRIKTSSYLCTPLAKQALQGHGKSGRLAPKDTEHNARFTLKGCGDKL